MIAFCVHCGASIVHEVIVSEGKVLPSKYIKCSNCGKLAGVKDAPAKKNSLSDLAAKKGEVAIKDGKIT